MLERIPQSKHPEKAQKRPPSRKLTLKIRRGKLLRAVGNPQHRQHFQRRPHTHRA